MKKIVTLSVLLTLFASTDSNAGNSSGGGGNELVKQFVSLASGLLNNYPWPADQRAILSKALHDSKIISTPVLLNPKTGKPIPHQKLLVAWGVRGFIQLKEDSGDPLADSWAKRVKGQKPLAPEVAHELYRASGLLGPNGKSIDDSYQLSITKYHLDTFPLLPSVDLGSGFLSDPNALLNQVKDIRPNGRLIYCQDGGAGSAEFLFAETNENNYILSIREGAYNGHTLGVILDSSIAPAFTNSSTGQFLQLTAIIPATIQNAAGPFPTCNFSDSSTSLIDCGLGSIRGSPILSDGVRSVQLDDLQFYFSTENQSIEKVSGKTVQVSFDYALYGNSHPFPAGFKGNSTFDPLGCTSR